MRFLFLLLALLTLPIQADQLKIATLHPLLSDLAREVGGERVEIVSLIEKNADPHHFEPSPAQLKAAADADLFLASGLGLESYLPSLRSILPSTSRVFEVGDSVPTIEGKCDHPEHQAHDHEHHHTDPHWWHSVDAFRRATNATAKVFAELDPDGAATYRTNALAYRQRLDQLESWVRREVARIPKERRVLATAHAAFGYFCRDFGFTPVPVQGLNREQMPDAKSLASLIASLREQQVTAIFPEKTSNPKILKTLTADIGLKLAPALIADGTSTDSYEAMVRHNVSTIVTTLK